VFRRLLREISVAMESSGDPPPTQAAGAGSEALLAPVQALLQEWRTMALNASGRHSAACDRYQHLDSIYGVGSTVLTAIVGSTIFVTLQKTASETIRIIAGMVAAVAAVASGIQTAAKYAQLAERYRQASRHYATVARRIDELLADPPDNAHVTGVLDQLRKSLDEVGALAPNVPPRIWSTRPDEEHRIAFPSHHDALRESEPQQKE
jgi:hypothetical protein